MGPRLQAQAKAGRTGALSAPPSGALPVPQLVDITESTEIRFEHLSSPEQKYIVESMSGGVALIDYDGDGWLDIYFTGAPSVAMELEDKKARSALYHNNHNGTFTDVTEKAGVGTPCWAMGAAVGDYNNDGRPDLIVSCFRGVILYRNNGDGTFTDVTKLRTWTKTRDGPLAWRLATMEGLSLHERYLAVPELVKMTYG